MPFVCTFVRRAFLGLITLMCFTIAVASEIVVEYHKATDAIRIQANNASLSDVLRRIAGETGIAIQIDPSVEKVVNYSFPLQTLDEAVRKIGKDLNYVIEYDTDKQEHRHIVGLKLLPQGQQDSDHLITIQAKPDGYSERISPESAPIQKDIQEKAPANENSTGDTLM